jgi:hypothetical protein
MDWFKKYKTTVVIVGVVGAAIIAVLFAPYYRIAASPLTGSMASGISGSFRVVRAVVYRPQHPDQSAFTTGIKSERYGGACVAFAAADLGYTAMAAKQCSTNLDCSNEKKQTEPDDPTLAPSEQRGVYRPDPVNDPNHYESRYGYCDRSAHACYAKPIYLGGTGANTNTGGIEGALCSKRVKGLSPAPWEEGIDNPLKVASTTLAKIGLKGTPAHARIVACLQGTSPPENGCKSVSGPDRVEVLGDVLTFN